MQITVAVVFAYLLGSVPFAFLVTRRRGIDLRHKGSGNLGATNVLRTAGVWPAVIVLLLDALKGSAAVLTAQVITTGTAAPVAAGLASILGHIYPAWLGFRGGKGVATAAGAFAVLAPAALGIAVVVFVITVAATRFVSAGSVAAAIALVIAAAVTNTPGPVVAGAAGAAIVILFRHRQNMERLAAGTERRVGLRPFGR